MVHLDSDDGEKFALWNQKIVGAYAVINAMKMGSKSTCPGWFHEVTSLPLHTVGYGSEYSLYAPSNPQEFISLSKTHSILSDRVLKLQDYCTDPLFSVIIWCSDRLVS